MSKASEAIGAYDGASLVLQSVRARVEVYCVEGRNGLVYKVRGDTNGRGEVSCVDAKAALDCALRCLAEYNT